MRFIEDLDWGSWLYGIFAGGIGGGATAVYGAIAASMIDSKHFGFGSAASFKLAGMMFGMSFVKDAALYLKQNPLPAVKRETTVSSARSTPAGTVITTVKETEMVQAETPKEPPAA
jgi:hypothetical protein